MVAPAETVATMPLMHQHAHHHLVTRLYRLRLDHLREVSPVVEADRLRGRPILAANWMNFVAGGLWRWFQAETLCARATSSAA